MKRVFSIFIRDFKSSIREFLLLYMMVGPLLLTFGFSLFIPSSEAATLQFAVVEGMDEAVVDHFERYGSVETSRILRTLTRGYWILTMLPE